MWTPRQLSKNPDQFDGAKMWMACKTAREFHPSDQLPRLFVEKYARLKYLSTHFTRCGHTSQLKAKRVNGVHATRYGAINSFAAAERMGAKPQTFPESYTQAFPQVWIIHQNIYFQ
jgi:hypothetical protein